MKQKWLRQTNDAENVIVFFSGWGFDESIVQGLTIENDTNVLFIDDYRHLDYQLPDLNQYQNRSLIAWSFGVAAYSAWQQQSPDNDSSFDYRVAINGSMTPVDRKTGIPDVVMQKTIDTLSVASFQVFAKKCFNPLDLKANQPFVIDVDIRKHELQQIKQRHCSINDLKSSPDTTLQWDKIWISRHDKIFPLRNLQRAWQDQKDRIELINAEHTPFRYWQNWHDILV